MLHITQWDTFICPNWRHFFLCCKKIIAMSISEHLCNLKFSHFLWRRRKAETESDNTLDIAGIEFFCHICFMAVPHDGNYIHSVFFSQTQITRCYQCFIFNSRSVDQKPEKSPQWKFNTFFPHWILGSLIFESKGIFYAWLEWGEWCKVNSKCRLPGDHALSFYMLFYPSCNEVGFTQIFLG